MRDRRLVASFALALPLLAALGTAPAASDSAATPGESWEVTSKMSIPGMPMAMPAQTQRVCSKPDAAPENPDPNCQNTESSRVGNKFSWRVQCTGAHAMSGRGEITYSSPDAYAGTIRFESAEGAMTLELSGKRLGACNARN